MLLLFNKLPFNKIQIMKIWFVSSALLLSAAVFAQKTTTEIPKNWYQLDRATSGYYGISLDKAYDFVKVKN